MDPHSAVSGLGVGRVLRLVPGFRSGRRLNAAIALTFYVLDGLFALIGLTTMFPSMVAMSLSALLVALLATDAGGIRTEVPGLRARNPLIASAFWLAVVVGLTWLSFAADDAFLSREERAARDARYARSPMPSTAITGSALESASPLSHQAPATSSAVPTIPATPPPTPTAVPPSPTPSLSRPTSSGSSSPEPTASPLSPTPASTSSAPTPQPGTPAPAPYIIVSRKDYSIAGRTRTTVRAVVAGTLSKEQKISTLAAIARTELRPNVVVVMAWRTTAEETDGGIPYTVGAAELSTDGQGWAVNSGNRTLDFGIDNGNVQGKVVTSTDTFFYATELFTAPR